MIRGTLPECCHSKAMEAQMYLRNLRYFDYPKFASPLRDEVRANAEKLAAEHGLSIQFVRNSGLRKDDIAAQALAQSRNATGLICVLSAMEGCRKFRPWHDKKTGHTHLKSENGQCIHYYFYINDPELGLCSLRVPTWSPFGLQFYFNGHNWLAKQLEKRGIDFEMADNSFSWIADFEKAQKITERFDAARLHAKLDRWAKEFCPCAQREFGAYHWSLWQVEFATDIAFKDAKSLGPIYHEISRTAACELKARSFATFLGRSLTNYKGEAGSRFKTRTEGTVVRHHMGPAAIKMYDKQGQVLRIETVLNDVGFLKTFREVMHRDGTSSLANAPVKKSIYSLRDLHRLMGAANRRYLTFISSLEERSVELAALVKLTQPVREVEYAPLPGFELLQQRRQVSVEDTPTWRISPEWAD